MIFFNFFTNLAGTNQLLNRQPYIDSISKLLNFEDTESGYYSNDFATSIASEIRTPSTSTRRHDPRRTQLTLKVVKALNPTLFKDAESTLPLVNGLVILDGGGGTLTSRYPAEAFYQQSLSLNTGGHHSRHGWQQGEVPEDSARIAQSLSDETGHGNNRYTSSDRHPNQFAGNFYKTFKTSIKLNEKIHINKEIHKQLLNDQNNLCIVDTFQSSQRIFTQYAHNEEVNGQFAAFRRLKDFICITLSLKSTIENSTNINVAQRDDPDFIDLFFNNLNGSVDGWNDPISEKSIKAYRETRKTDINPRFEHLNFDRLTNDLFNQTEDDLISQLTDIEAITFNNYIKQNHIGQINNKEIYSFFLKDFYKKFLHIKNRKGSHEDASPEPIIENIIVLDDMAPINLEILPQVNHNYNCWDFQNRFTRNDVKIIPQVDSNEDYLPLGAGFGLTFVCGEQKTQLTQAISSLTQNRISGIIFNGFTKATNKEPFEFISLTKRQALIRKGFFIPMLFPIKYRDEEFELKDGYSFSLVCLTSSFSDMVGKKRSRNALYDFVSNYQGSQGKYFTNKSEYLALQKEYMAELVEYSEWLTPSFKSFGTSNIAMLKKALKEKKKRARTLETSIDTTFLDNLSSVPNVNPIIKRKYNKVSTHYKRLLQRNNNISAEIFTCASSMANNLHDLESWFHQIEQLKERIKLMEEETTRYLTELKDNFNSRIEVSETIAANQGLYDSIKARYDVAYQTAVDNKDYDSNGFFKNMLENNQISICSLKVLNKSRDVLELKNCQHSKSIINNFNKSKYKIKEVEFLINSPVIINVDGGSKGQVCGGPYAIKVDQRNLHIALLYPSSIHGVNGEKIFIHPHASNTNRNRFVNMFSKDEFSWSSACLGEGSALLYNGFEKNDLKTILLAALTWVKSANSLDAWGKNYKYFPTPDKLALLQPGNTNETTLEESINEDDVHEFLEEMIEETTVEAPLEEVTPPPQDENPTQGFTPDQFAQPVDGYVPAYSPLTTT